MRIGQDVPASLEAALAMEWSLADGIGGSASGTAAGANARRTHSLLTATRPASQPVTLLLRIDERVLGEDGTFELGSALVAGGASRPAGHKLIESFALDPWPVWRYRAGETVLEKSVMLVDGHHAVVVAYRHVSGPAVRLTLSPLTAARDPQQLQRENPHLRGAAQGVPGRVRLEFGPDDPSLTLWHNGAFIPARVWVRQLHYPLDAVAAGAPEYEDAFVPGHIEGGVAPGEALYVVASSEGDLFRALAAEDRLGTPPPRSLAECIRVLELDRRAALAATATRAIQGADFTARQAAAAHGKDMARRREALVDAEDPWVPQLAAAFEDGLVRGGPRMGLLEAMPGCDESGVASVRSLSALIALRAFDEARAVLSGATEYLNEGLAAERFDRADGTPLYGDPAASLWLVAAGEAFARRSEDLAFVRDTLYAPLESVMQSFRSGTNRVRVGESGLLEARIDDAWTTRTDLNVLWYHAMVAMAQLARLTGRREHGAFYLAWARDHQLRFHDTLWDVSRGTLYRGIDAAGPVRGLSPAHALAASLSPSIVPSDRAASLVDAIERELLTPCGLLDEPGGTVARPLELGAFFTAYLRVYARDRAAQARVHGWLEGLRPYLGLSGVPAAFRLAADGTWRADGMRSPLAAAELLRFTIEELDRAEPRNTTLEPALGPATAS